MADIVVSKYKYEIYLLVEGDDDKHLFDHLLGHHQIIELCRVQNEDLQVKDKGGFENLVKTLKTELKRSGLRRLGIIVDANDKILYRWQSLQDRLIEFGYSKAVIPPAPSIGGTIIEQENLPMVGDRKSTRLNSSHTVISYAVFCLKKKKNKKNTLLCLNIL